MAKLAALLYYREECDALHVQPLLLSRGKQGLKTPYPRLSDNTPRIRLAVAIKQDNLKSYC